MLNFHSEENLAMLWKQAVFICHYNSCSQSFSHVRLFLTPWTVACQAPLSTEILKQEKRNRLPLPTAGDLPNPGIKPVSLESPALEGRFFTTSITWEALYDPCYGTNWIKHSHQTWSLMNGNTVLYLYRFMRHEDGRRIGCVTEEFSQSFY